MRALRFLQLCWFHRSQSEEGLKSKEGPFFLSLHLEFGREFCFLQQSPPASRFERSVRASCWNRIYASLFFTSLLFVVFTNSDAHAHRHTKESSKDGGCQQQISNSTNRTCQGYDQVAKGGDGSAATDVVSARDHNAKGTRFCNGGDCGYNGS
jgi:hypothetical protein